LGKGRRQVGGGRGEKSSRGINIIKVHYIMYGNVMKSIKMYKKEIHFKYKAEIN
jgi:hypothetical protein